MILHNGIISPDKVGEVLPDCYRHRPSFCVSPHTPGYLLRKPAVIPIDCGRQLFVDDFLIEYTELQREFFSPRPVGKGPVLAPETALELNSGICPVAAPFKDGAFYDAADRKFKLWYQAGWFGTIAYAESSDGIHWERIPIRQGTNSVLPFRRDRVRDGACVWLDQESQDERFKMYLFTRDSAKREYSELRISADGLTWSRPVELMPGGDTSSFFYNPFRNRWVMSVRRIYQDGAYLYRYRSYREADSFMGLAECKEEFFWQSADAEDQRDSVYDCDPQLYSLDCVAYESLLLGMYQIYKGPHNLIAEKLARPKRCDLYLGFSRDGLQFSRENRTPFLAGTGSDGDWNEGYIHPAGGLCIVNDESLYFYFGAWSGVSPRLGRHMYAGGSTGLAELRRDGFAALTTKGMGQIVTPVVRFTGEDLWVNASCKALRAEVRSCENLPLEGLSFEDCLYEPIDSVKKLVRWKRQELFKKAAGQPVRIAFEISDGALYSFWVAHNAQGASGGYLAAGSTRNMGIRDI